MTSSLSKSMFAIHHSSLFFDTDNCMRKKKLSVLIRILANDGSISFNKITSNECLSKGGHFQNKYKGTVKMHFSIDHSRGKEDGGEDDGFLRKKLAIFVSGRGSNFRALHESILYKDIYGDIVVIISDKPACEACDYARNNNIPMIEYPRSEHALAGLSAVDLVAKLREYGIDFVVLAGYLKMLPLELIQAFPRAIVNMHPALLPAFGGKGFYGMKVHEAVIKSGARFSGATVHFVDEEYDHGVILAQRVVPVLPYDTPRDLAARILKEEHGLYREVVAALCEDRIFWREDGVPLIRKSWKEAEYY